MCICAGTCRSWRLANIRNVSSPLVLINDAPLCSSMRRLKRNSPALLEPPAESLRAPVSFAVPTASKIYLAFSVLTGFSLVLRSGTIKPSERRRATRMPLRAGDAGALFVSTQATSVGVCDNGVPLARAELLADCSASTVESDFALPELRRAPLESSCSICA